jgi:phosphatidylserine/phosphatidylglycerophosphate/cardiolipin synthase-like enzyme
MYTLIVDGSYKEEAFRILEGATQEIILSTFKIQYEERRRGDNLRLLINKILNKLRQGVRVRFLMNWEAKGKGVAKVNAHVADILTAAGADVRYLKDARCCHSKILIVDGKVLILGSHNWSIPSMNNNFETSILIDDPGIIEKVKEVFDRTYSAARRWRE